MARLRRLTAPGDDGQPNTTGGPATGQCAGLT
jgi:hypothetical protein